MKKILCFFMVALLAALLVVPCFAADTTVDRGDPVDWFGGGGSPYYHCEVTSYNSALSSALSGTEYPCLNGVYSYYTSSIDHDAAHTETIYFDGITGNGSNTSYMKFRVNGTYQAKMIVSAENLIEFSWDFETLPSALESPISGLTITAPGGAEGFVDAGFSDALTELSTIVSAILSNQYILIAIGLAVAVPLVAWGISKIKSLVKGY